MNQLQQINLPNVIDVDEEKCINCHACISACPVKFCNDGSSDVVKVNANMCIACGKCLSACTHEARYYKDDFELFREALAENETIKVVLEDLGKTFEELGIVFRVVSDDSTESLNNAIIVGDSTRNKATAALVSDPPGPRKLLRVPWAAPKTLRSSPGAKAEASDAPPTFAGQATGHDRQHHVARRRDDDAPHHLHSRSAHPEPGDRGQAPRVVDRGAGAGARPARHGRSRRRDRARALPRHEDDLCRE